MSNKSKKVFKNSSRKKKDISRHTKNPILNFPTPKNEKYFSPESSRRLKIKHITKICSDSGVCIALGRYSEDIKQMFDFTSFKHIDGSTNEPPIKRIGIDPDGDGEEDSDNGFINQIAYSIKIKGLFGETDYNYKAYAVLKSAQSEKADNLLYEFLVGEFINTQNVRFPCFLETYGLFKYNDEDTWNQLQKSSNDKTILNPANIEPLLWDHYVNDIPYDTGCKDSKYLALLTQHLKGITPLYDKIYDVSDILSFANQDLLYILFQIYVPLGLLKYNFTHYDLHLKNVVLYTQVKGKYIEYHYHLSKTEVVVFKSQYMVKIIDYGQCYFKDDTSGIDSKKIYNALCAEPVCKNCGADKGFLWLTVPPDNTYYISSKKRNMSYDLMILNNIKKKFNSISLKIPYIDKINITYMTVDGTPEVTERGLPTGKINNVQDAADFFISQVQKNEAMASNDAFYADFTSLGELHIYCNNKLDKDKTMEFIPNDN